MFNELPLTFQAELSFMMNKKVLEKVCDKLYTQLTEFDVTMQIFNWWCTGRLCFIIPWTLQASLFRGLNPGFKRMLSMVIRPVFYMPNQMIASKGDIGHHMFYIHHGRAEVRLSLCYIFISFTLNPWISLKQRKLLVSLRTHTYFRLSVVSAENGTSDSRKHVCVRRLAAGINDQKSWNTDSG